MAGCTKIFVGDGACKNLAENGKGGILRGKLFTKKGVPTPPPPSCTDSLVGVSEVSLNKENQRYSDRSLQKSESYHTVCTILFLLFLAS